MLLIHFKFYPLIDGDICKFLSDWERHATFGQLSELNRLLKSLEKLNPRW